MMEAHYALLALGHGRSTWLGRLSSWAVSGMISAEIVKCLSGSEVRSRLAGMQRYSALIVDATVLDTDRDLLTATARYGVPTIIVGQSVGANPCQSSGASAVLDPGFSPMELTRLIDAHGSAVEKSEFLEVVDDSPSWRGKVIGVCGPGGTGASTIAMALAQATADTTLDGTLVVLADFARNGEQAMLHDASDVVPAVEELVEAHRGRRPPPDEIRALTHFVANRGYSLLLGMRRPTNWNALPASAVEAAVDGLARSFSTVIADITADFEGEESGGSLDVEERNAPARSVARVSDLVIAVGAPGMKGTHSLVRLIASLVEFGTDSSRILPVVNQSERSRATNSEITRALRSLLPFARDHMPPPVFLRRVKLEQALRCGTRLPDDLGTPVAKAVVERLQDRMPRTPSTFAPEKVVPGSLKFSRTFAGQ